MVGGRQGSAASAVPSTSVKDSGVPRPKLQQPHPSLLSPVSLLRFLSIFHEDPSKGLHSVRTARVPTDGEGRKQQNTRPTDRKVTQTDEWHVRQGWQQGDRTGSVEITQEEGVRGEGEKQKKSKKDPAGARRRDIHRGRVLGVAMQMHRGEMAKG